MSHIIKNNENQKSGVDAQYASVNAAIQQGIRNNEVRQQACSRSKPKVENFHAEIGTYEAGDMLICELCGSTFFTNDESRDCCYECQA